MKSITIHNLEDPLDTLIRQRAKKGGVSLNKAIKGLLEESLGIKKNHASNYRNDFLDLFGIWSKKDLKDFNASLKDFDKIESEDWQ